MTQWIVELRVEVPDVATEEAATAPHDWTADDWIEFMHDYAGRAWLFCAIQDPNEEPSP